MVRVDECRRGSGQRRRKKKGEGVNYAQSVLKGGGKSRIFLYQTPSRVPNLGCRIHLLSYSVENKQVIAK